MVANARDFRVEVICAEQTLQVRRRVFLPNKSIEKSRITEDHSASHFGAFSDNELVAVASVFHGKNSARLRKLATLVSYRRRGIASLLIEHIEFTLAKDAEKSLWLFAEESLCGFYQLRGFSLAGDSYCRHGITYFKMNLIPRH